MGLKGVENEVRSWKNGGREHHFCHSLLLFILNVLLHTVQRETIVSKQAKIDPNIAKGEREG